MGEGFPKSKLIWFNGKFISWNKAQVHFLTHALHYGSACFEGIRCYETINGRAIFRLKEHIKRLFNSAKIFGMKVPFTEKELINACKELIKKNNLKSAYIRPLIFYDYGIIGLNPGKAKVSCGIAAFKFETYLGKKALEKGVKMKVSSFARHHVNVMMTKAKLAGNYVNSILAKQEAIAANCDEAIMLDVNGFVSECTGENLFIVRNNELITPPKTTILEGITRDSIIEIALNEGFKVKEEMISRDQLYVSDEVFVSGTAAEITPVKEIDFKIIGTGKRGLITEKLQKKFFEIVKGKNEKYFHWLEFI